MKSLVTALAFAATTALAQESPSPSPDPETEANPTPDIVRIYENSASARAKALELAGAFTNEGFKIRDGFHAAKIARNEVQIVEVNLFAGNEYWLCAGADERGRKLAVAIYDEGGNRLEVEPFEAARMAAAGIIPAYSGRYYVAVELTDGDPAEYVLLYAYK